MAADSQQNKAGPVSLADEEAVKQVLVSTVFGLWDIALTSEGLSLQDRPPRRAGAKAT